MRRASLEPLALEGLGGVAQAAARRVAPGSAPTRLDQLARAPRRSAGRRPRRPVPAARPCAAGRAPTARSALVADLVDQHARLARARRRRVPRRARRPPTLSRASIARLAPACRRRAEPGCPIVGPGTARRPAPRRHGRRRAASRPSPSRPVGRLARSSRRRPRSLTAATASPRWSDRSPDRRPRDRCRAHRRVPSRPAAGRSTPAGRAAVGRRRCPLEPARPGRRCRDPGRPPPDRRTAGGPVAATRAAAASRQAGRRPTRSTRGASRSCAAAERSERGHGVRRYPTAPAMPRRRPTGRRAAENAKEDPAEAGPLP